MPHTNQVFYERERAMVTIYNHRINQRAMVIEWAIEQHNWNTRFSELADVFSAITNVVE
jgi:hypothetical protein